MLLWEIREPAYIGCGGVLGHCLISAYICYEMPGMLKWTWIHFNEPIKMFICWVGDIAISGRWFVAVYLYMASAVDPFSYIVLAL